MPDAVDEFSDFQSSPSSWLINKLSRRGTREADALRAAVVDVVLSAGVFALAAYLALEWVDKPRPRPRSRARR